MAITRREFLKLAGLFGAVAAAGTIGHRQGRTFLNSLFKGLRAKTLQCPFCSVGCSALVYFKKKTPVYVKGNPDDPVSRGSLCSKAFMMVEYIKSINNDAVVQYRKPYSSKWETISWDAALPMIADRIKKTRDESFVQFDKNVTVNRTEGISVVAGSNLTNEEGYLLTKFSRILGIPYVATESFIRGDKTDEIMCSTFGMPGSTNPWTDLAYSSSILIIGANPARNSSVIMNHISKARQNGSKIIAVDPVNTETASFSDIFCQINPGTDKIFLLGVINNAISNNRINREYLSEYTDASFILSQDTIKSISSSSLKSKNEYERDERGNPKRDDEMRNIKTVYQVMKDCLSKYTPSYVSEATGCPVEKFLEAAEAFSITSNKNAAGSVIIGSGITGDLQGDTVKLLTILQSILGNIGISGGGMYYKSTGANALGITYQIPSINSLPGVLPLPSSEQSDCDDDYFKYIKNRSVTVNNPLSANVRQNLKKHITSLLKAWFGKSAVSETRYNFDWLPKTSGSDYTWQEILKTKVKGLIVLGSDHLKAGKSFSELSGSLKNMDWVVCSRNSGFFSDFWEPAPSTVKTEIFNLPVLPLFFKEGSVTNSDRTTIWNSEQYKNNDLKSELEIIHEIFSILKSKYAKDGVLPEPVSYSQWENRISASSVSREMSGFVFAGKEPVRTADDLADNGSTACGNIFYAGMNYEGNYSENKDNSASGEVNGIYKKWGWSVPQNVRVLYNRASVERNGTAWADERSPINYNGSEKKYDVVHGKDYPKDINPFILNKDGVAYLFDENAKNGGFPFKKSESNDPSSKDGKVLLTGFGQGVFLSTSRLFCESLMNNVAELPLEYASARKIKNGDFVRIKNERGEGVFRAVSSLRCGKHVVLRGGDVCRFINSRAERSKISSYDIQKINPVNDKKGIS